MTVCHPGGMTDQWLDEIPEPEADAIMLDVVVESELGVIVHATTVDGREGFGAEGAW